MIRRPLSVLTIYPGPATSSHTVGVEFANKVITIGSGTKRTRMKLQVRV